MEDRCEMCGTVIHSISTRRAGDHQFCIDCGDNIVLPVVNACANAHAEALIKHYKEHGYDKTCLWADDVTEELLAR